ncbi:hypothetical protein HS7_20640 [Sulfolobales archaeon HS-7]|nr:hypothetical protein HS7_20640 [Sulfolobales archaeon HS-7]
MEVKGERRKKGKKRGRVGAHNRVTEKREFVRLEELESKQRTETHV